MATAKTAGAVEQPTDPSVDEQLVDQAAAADVPSYPSVVRLDDPAAGGEPRYGLLVGESLVIGLPPAGRYELPTYPLV